MRLFENGIRKAAFSIRWKGRLGKYFARNIDKSQIALTETKKTRPVGL